MNKLCTLIAGLVLATASITSVAQTPAATPSSTYPNKPVKVIVPYPPGGPTDIVARLVFQHVSEATGQQFVIENRAGAGGTIGAEAVARAPADGYTLLVATTAHAINMSLFKNSPAAPEVPTIAESGLPGYEVFAWNGLVAPAGTPKAVIAQLSEELRKAMQLPQVKEKFSVQGFAASWDTPEQFGSFLRAEVDKWTSGPRQ